LEALAALTCEQHGRSGADQSPGDEGPLQVAEAADFVRAARLFGAAAALRQAIGTLLAPIEQEAHRHQVDRVRQILGEEEFAAAWSEGRVMDLDEAVACAIGHRGCGR